MTKNNSKLIRAVIELLNERVEYAVLRNFEGLPDNPSRDIDVIINRRQFYRIRKAIVEVAEKNGYWLLQYYKGSEMHSMVFAICEPYINIISFDFLFSAYVRDVILYDATSILSKRQSNGNLYHVRIDDEFLVKYLYNKFLGEKYPQKYTSTKTRAYKEYKDTVEKELTRFNCNIENITPSLWHYRLKNFITRPLIQFRAEVRYYKSTINNIFSHKGITIGFTGPDGSGKTTVIDEIVSCLEPLYKVIPVYHFRPTLFSNLGETAHTVGIKKEVDRNYSAPHRGSRTGFISSIIRLSYYSLDYMVGYIVKVKRLLFQRKLVVFDRYFTDIICDARRSRIYLPVKLLNLWRKLFIPSLDYNVLLTASSDTILSRKRELDEAGIKAINDRIDYLATQPGYLKVMNESTPDAAVTVILKHIFNQQHQKNLKRLK